MQKFFSSLNLKSNICNLNEGQTLIETMVAVFILVMGVTAATGLAVYALSTSTNVTKQIIATGLAREGIEAMKNMRDTNWLQGTLVSCTDVSGTGISAKCYPAWDTTPYCIDNGGGNGNCSNGKSGPNYFLQFDSTAGATSYWALTKTNGGSAKY